MIINRWFKVYDPFAYTYSGTSSEEMVGAYRYITLTASGTFTVTGGAGTLADVFLCGGGNRPISNSTRVGGNGALVNQQAGVPISSSTVTIGAGASANNTVGGETAAFGLSSGIASVTNAGNSNGATGTTTVPYPGDAKVFDRHAAGGAYGADKTGAITQTYGYTGGTDGSARGALATVSQAAGGDLGGGAGGYYSGSPSGKAATFYGGGGGGTGLDTYGGGTVSTTGNGYQGVVYIRIPV